MSDFALFYNCGLVSVKESLATWRREGVAAVWLRVPLTFGHLIPCAAAQGFLFHHAEGSEATMKLWLPRERADLTPQFATHQLGVSGIVVREDTQEVLVVQDKNRPSTDTTATGQSTDTTATGQSTDTTATGQSTDTTATGQSTDTTATGQSTGTTATDTTATDTTATDTTATGSSPGHPDLSPYPSWGRENNGSKGGNVLGPVKLCFNELQVKGGENGLRTWEKIVRKKSSEANQRRSGNRGRLHVSPASSSGLMDEEVWEGATTLIGAHGHCSLEDRLSVRYSDTPPVNSSGDTEFSNCVDGTQHVDSELRETRQSAQPRDIGKEILEVLEMQKKKHGQSHSYSQRSRAHS
ncbi:hypothetical protein ACOMHN_048953 [Nucella lapillus]